MPGRPAAQSSERGTGLTPRDAVPHPVAPGSHRGAEAPSMAARLRGRAAAVPVAGYQIKHQ
ncbi:hypothetical protein AB0D87_18095 [Streptomyces sp. NPDC048342]|uniref:hypothetical protein n=1 Tax=unclassified Streptomyces TaxID=2593676 RepID=UPI003447CF9E